MGLIRLHHGSWENHRVSRCTQAHTHVEQNKLNGDNHFHIYCMYKNKPTDSFRLQISGVFQSFQEEKKKMIVGGVETAWTSAGLDPCWSPWQPQKIPDPSLRLWRLDVGQRPALTQVCLQGAMLPEERRNRLFSAIKGKTNAPLEGGITPCLLII